MLWWSRIRWNGPAVWGCLLSTVNSVRVSVCSCRRITPCSSIWKHRIFFFVFVKPLHNDVLKLKEVSVTRPFFFLKVATRWQSHAALTLSNVLTVSSSIVACVMMLMSMSASYLQEDFKDLLNLTHTGHKGTQTWHAGWHTTICLAQWLSTTYADIFEAKGTVEYIFCFLFFWVVLVLGFYVCSVWVWVSGCGCGREVHLWHAGVEKRFYPTGVDRTIRIWTSQHTTHSLMHDFDNLDLCLWEM